MLAKLIWIVTTSFIILAPVAWHAGHQSALLITTYTSGEGLLIVLFQK
jgi:uncharacterized membrane protein YkgB